MSIDSSASAKELKPKFIFKYPGILKLELVIADFNAEMDQTELINESLLMQAKGTGARFKGDMTARAENIKGVASLLSTANSAGYI